MGAVKLSDCKFKRIRMSFWLSKLDMPRKHFQHQWRWLRRPASFSVLWGTTIFALALVSLFSGSLIDLDLNPQEFLKRTSFFKKMYNFIEGHHAVPINIWKAEVAHLYYGCSDRSPQFSSAIGERSSNGYLLIAASGGLNQQRVGIADAVIVARILNATLIVPVMDHHSFWKDGSDFVDIFDVDWFISSLSKDVKTVNRVPDKVMRSMEKPPYTMRVPRRSSPEYYLEEVLPILLRRRDLGPEGELRRGKCPLTPHEVGLMLRGLGFRNDSYIYVASGEIFGGEKSLAPLQGLYPNLLTKEMLAKEELLPFMFFSSRLAAIDYVVCDESDVFVTDNNGNNAKVLAGRRRYMGHKRTIRPNTSRLRSLLKARHEMNLGCCQGRLGHARGVSWENQMR